MYRYKYHRFGNSRIIVSNILNILKKYQQRMFCKTVV